MVACGRRSIFQIPDFAGQGAGGDITIESLVFDQFITVLKEEIQFDTAKQSISYCCSKGITMQITSDRTWKAVIREMHMEGMDRFIFHVVELGEWSTDPSHTYHD